MLLLAIGLAACAPRPGAQESRPARGRDAVVPGLTVLMEDSLALLAGKRIGIITNQTGVDAQGRSVVDLLFRDPRARAANITVVRLFSPEHGIRGVADRPNLPDEIDRATGLTVHSLYTNETIPPPDSLLRDLDALVFDLQDIGTRTWTYVGVMVYAMRAAARADIPFIVLDRPNPISGRVEGPLLDASLANPEDPTPGRRGRAYALYPAPLRHGMTMAELARWFAAELEIPAKLHVVPMRGWRRGMYWDDTKLPWVVPSPAMVSPTSAFLYPALVAFERSNVSVGRGTDLPFQRVGAPWMDASAVVDSLNARNLHGLRFEVERFTPRNPTDGKYGNRSIPGVRVIVVERERAQMARLGAAMLWAIAKVHPDSLEVNARGFDERFGMPSVREGVLGDGDPDELIDAQLPGVIAWQQATRQFLIYR